MDAADELWVAGRTDSTDFPTASPLQPANHGGAFDVFLARIGCPPSEPLPPDQGNVLRAAKAGADVALAFPGAPASLWRVFRDIDKRSLGRSALTPDAARPSFIDPGAVVGPPGGGYYQVKELSPCRLLEGP